MLYYIILNIKLYHIISYYIMLYYIIYYILYIISYDIYIYIYIYHPPWLNITLARPVLESGPDQSTLLRDHGTFLRWDTLGKNRKTQWTSYIHGEFPACHIIANG